jgi:hypothetical protein
VPLDDDAVRGLVDLESVGMQDRLVTRTGIRAPERRSQPRDELIRAKRLGHVVVGAGVECPYLLFLFADRGQHDDRHVAPLADGAADFYAVAVRQNEVDDRGIDGTDGRAVERLLRG